MPISTIEICLLLVHFSPIINIKISSSCPGQHYKTGAPNGPVRQKVNFLSYHIDRLIE
jgi:hypothetical protein